MDYLLPGYVIGDYVIVEQIGSGAFSTVYRARHTAGRFDAALKLISKHTNIEGAHQLYENEVKVLKMAQDFPFVVHFYEAFEIPSFFVISMEFLENGSVADSIYQFNSKSGFIDIEPLKIFNQMIAAIDFLHNTLHIIHCDIKSENVMLDASGNARLSDFGLAKIFDPENEDKIEQVAGSLKAIAPEQFKRGYTCPKSDLWSAGILLYELVYNKLPYNDNCMTSLAKKIMYQGLHFPADSPNAHLLGSANSSACSSARSNACSSANSSACSSARSNSSSNDGTPKFSCDVDKRREEIKDLITEMLQKDPKERISYQDILDHPCMIY
ncbi:CAMK family protein kinase [Tritrichomonas foetus]|uniref:CAMK family protein kinase n=1 Tax=Tritrichomonas foetus TaxID=1144522 RepID=A0A1J4JUN8_9EUKA|nr:CAMK family protein kinase [Tritrichomonas foetus]|eukprot:OHT01236.1 CAMK family protein kinase [Tritrichomonas foetus]